MTLTDKNMTKPIACRYRIDHLILLYTHDLVQETDAITVLISIHLLMSEVSVNALRLIKRLRQHGKRKPLLANWIRQNLIKR